MREFNEADWTLLKRLKPVALDRLCRRILQEASDTCGSDGDSHERFLRLFSQLQRANEAVSRAFDDLRRSTAATRLAAMRRQDLMTEEEFSRFTQRTRDSVKALNTAR